MAHWALEPLSAYVPLGMLYSAVGLTVWTVLVRQADPLSAGLWCGGVILTGAGYALVGTIGWDSATGWAALGALLSLIGYVFRVSALRRDAGTQANIWAPLMALAALMGIMLLDLQASDMHAALFHLGHLAGATWLASESYALWRSSKLRNALWLTLAYGLFATTSLIRLLVWSASKEAAFAIEHWAEIDLLLNMSGAILASLYGGYGYLGLALERSHANQLTQAQRLIHEAERSERERAKSSFLESQLQEKTHLLHLLTDEVRTPASRALTNVSNVKHQLQFDPELSESSVSFVQQLHKGQELLCGIVRSVDNTLTALALSQQRLKVHLTDMEMATLIDLVWADFSRSQRKRLAFSFNAKSQTVSVDMHLMRLALRNLLIMGLESSGQEGQVSMRLEDTEDPLAWVIHISCTPAHDLTDTMNGHLEQESVTYGPGLGFHVTRQIIGLHGGQLEEHYQSGRAGKWEVRLCLPQGHA